MESTAYIVAGVDPKDLKVRWVEIFSENANSVTRLDNTILLDVYALPGDSFGEARDSAREFLRTFPPLKPLYDLYLKTGRR